MEQYATCLPLSGINKPTIQKAVFCGHFDNFSQNQPTRGALLFLNIEGKAEPLMHRINIELSVSTVTPPQSQEIEGRDGKASSKKVLRRKIVPALMFVIR